MTSFKLLKGMDIFGKFLLAWFGFATFLYFWSGLFFTEIENIRMISQSGSYWWLVHHLVLVPTSAFAVFFMVPLLLKGRWLGFLIFLLYLAFGHFVNPFWYLFPVAWFGTENEGPTVFSYGINILWSVVMLLGIIAFFYSRRLLGSRLATLN